jgi:protein-L-isoaspartate(D-aspartate) O-methyltransferase
MSEFAAQRRNMVEGQVRANDVTDRRIQSVMAEIPRERFIPEALSAVAYADSCPKVGVDRHLLDPRCFSKLVQLAAVRPNDRVLDIGCASGYSSVVLSQLAREVVSVEEDPGLAANARELLASYSNITVVEGTLRDGAKDHSPFDVIFLNGAVEYFPQSLTDQLADGGRLVGVLSEGNVGKAHLLVNAGGCISDRVAFDADVPELPGFQRARSFAL